jgi:hypothetical protein
MSHTYRLGSSKLLSDIELPELTPWVDDFRATDIIQFRLGRAEVTGSGQRYVIQGPRRVVIEDGVRVTVELANDDDMADVRALLMGPVQAILWHQRGLLPLHASAVSANGSAIAIAGPSGTGKSTLAAQLSALGCPALADDICIVDPSSSTVLMGQRRLRLWRNALDHLGIPVAGLPRAMSRTEKFVLIREAQLIPERQPLAHIVLPVRTRERSVQVHQLHGADATLAVTNVVHMLPVAHELNLGAAVFQALILLQTRGVRVWRAFVPDDLATIKDAASELLAKLNV